LAIVVSFREKSFVLKQPSPRATMAALYVRLPGSYTTSRGTIAARDYPSNPAPFSAAPSLPVTLVSPGC